MPFRLVPPYGGLLVSISETTLVLNSEMVPIINAFSSRMCAIHVEVALDKKKVVN